MSRPKQEQPTSGELEVLKVLWDRGPSTVREVMEVLNQTRERAYTSVMSLLNVMTEKRLLVREPRGRAFVYRPRTGRDKTLGRLVSNLLSRAFEGSTSQLVMHLLDNAQPSADELAQIQQAIEDYQQQKGE